MVLDLEKRTYLLVTGASRGIGQRMAVELADHLKSGSIVVLLARTEQGLAQTKSGIEALGKDLKVYIFSIDLSIAKGAQFHEILDKSLQGEDVRRFERAFILHNAGTVGDVSKSAVEVSNTDDWQVYFHMNVFSVIALNCEFFRTFVGVPKLVVNISSKCGIEPFGSMSFYCSGKAAREMYFRVLALEQEKEDVLVLNYAPGAIDTAMTELVQRQSVNKELTEFFKMQRDTKTMLTTGQTTEKLLKVLQEQKFKSGDHVDYWDDEE